MKIPAPVDMHVHFRQGKMLEDVVPHHDRVFEYALAMPNLTPPIVASQDVTYYERTLRSHCKRMNPLVAIMLTPYTTPQTITEARAAGAFAAKLYPQNMTTNSGDGIPYTYVMHCDGYFKDLLATMQDLNMPLCVHGETPAVFTLDAEQRFLEALDTIVSRFPKLRITLEHITTEAAVAYIKMAPSCAATITLHHLHLTLNDVVGRKIRPHNFCLPIAKRETDRTALHQVINSMHPRFFFGSDSAPHVKESKICSEGCAGCFTAPFLIEGLFDVFSNLYGEKFLDRLIPFVSMNARMWYNLPAPGYTLDVYPGKFDIPLEYHGVVPFKAGETLGWKAHVSD